MLRELLRCYTSTPFTARAEGSKVRPARQKDYRMRGQKMSRICTVCGYSESRVIADARALGFEEGFRSGSYSCCQIARWADEQWLAWLQAMREDAEAASASSAVDAVDPEAA